MSKFWCSLALLVFSATDALAEFRQIQTEPEFAEKIVGKTLSDRVGNWTRFKPDGQITGRTIGGAKYSGAWKFTEGMLCRTLKLGKARPESDCQIFELYDSFVRVRPNHGRDEAELWFLK